MMYTETTFLDAVFEYILGENTDKIDGDAIKTLRAFIMANEYDSDAIKYDFEDKTNESNICNIVNSKESIINPFVDFIRNCQCMLQYILV